MSQLRSRLISFITHHISEELISSLDLSIRGAYRDSYLTCEAKITRTDPSRLRAQMRRYLIDEGIMEVSTQHSEMLSTFPKGERYILVTSGPVTMSHVEVHKGKYPRSAKHRQLIAHKNLILEPYTPDLFKANPPDLDDRLHCVLVITHPISSEDQSTPSSIQLAIPHTDWTGYHLEITLDDLYQCYNTDSSQLPDNAWPSLKDALRREEKKKS